MRMAKTPEAVTTFLLDLSQKLQTLKEAEMKLFLEYKKEEVQFTNYMLSTSININSEVIMWIYLLIRKQNKSFYQYHF